MVELASGDLQLDNSVIIPAVRRTTFVNKEFVVEGLSHSCGMLDRTYLAGYLRGSITP
jgi:hypothetical protein